MMDRRPEHKLRQTYYYYIPSCCNYLEDKFPPDAATFTCLHSLLLSKKRFADGYRALAFPHPNFLSLYILTNNGVQLHSSRTTSTNRRGATCGARRTRIFVNFISPLSPFFFSLSFPSPFFGLSIFTPRDERSPPPPRSWKFVSVEQRVGKVVHRVSWKSRTIESNK